MRCGREYSSIGVLRQVRVGDSEGKFHESERTRLLRFRDRLPERTFDHVIGVGRYRAIAPKPSHHIGHNGEFGFGPGGRASLGCGEGVGWGD
jgi:hypothetical protein